MTSVASINNYGATHGAHGRPFAGKQQHRDNRQLVAVIAASAPHAAFVPVRLSATPVASSRVY